MARGIKAVIEEPVKPFAIHGDNEDRWEKQRVEESRLIKGVFNDNELRGGTIKFPFRKFKNDKINVYELTDGQEYELPLSVVRHLNTDCAYHQHSYILDSAGKAMKNPKKVHRFSFKPIEVC